MVEPYIRCEFHGDDSVSMHNRKIRIGFILVELFLTQDHVFPRTASDLPSTPSKARRPAWLAHLDVKSTLFRQCCIVVAALQLSGCSWFSFFHSAPVEHPTGAVSVAPASEFVYLPARSGHVSANRIENTAMTGIVLKTDINEAVRNDVAHELQIVGLNVVGAGKVLSGHIEAFSVDDVRSPAVWTLKVHYVVHDALTHQIVYAGTKTVKQKCPKFTNVLIALDDTVKLSVSALIKDPAFVRSVN